MTNQTATGWWGARWLTYAQEELLGIDVAPARLKRAHGAEVELRVQRGRIDASVVGGSSVFAASLRVKPLAVRDWKKALDAIAADAQVAQRLLAGQPGPELERILQQAGVSLFPVADHSSRAPVRCTCPQGWDCRHILVLMVRLGELLDASPLLWLEVLGAEPTEVLAGVRARLADRSAPAPAQAEALLDPEWYWHGALDPESIAVRSASSIAPDALLRRLGPLPLAPLAVETRRDVTLNNGETVQRWSVEKRPLESLLQQYVVQVAATAAGLAQGELPPVYQKESLPGKPVPLAPRLAAEIAAAVLAADRPLFWGEVLETAPTLVALPPEEAYAALESAKRQLPPEVVPLGERVGTRPGFLAAARFAHVVTFTEWRARRLAPDATWQTALRVLGQVGPYAVLVEGERLHLPDQEDRLFARLAPAVGDELLFAVADPLEPLLTVRLHRRPQRNLAVREIASAQAAHALARLMADGDLRRLTELDAVALLLGAGRYDLPNAPDPVWLLPAPGGPLYRIRDSRDVTIESWWHEQPSFGRSYPQPWPRLQSALSGYGIGLAQAGGSRADAEAALSCVRRWCNHWPAPQDDPAALPPVGRLLHFLWVFAPQNWQAKGQPERVPAFLAGWFRFLERQYPAVAGLYGEQIAACELQEAYAHRLATCPADQRDAGAWQREGYRWLGPEVYFG